MIARGVKKAREAGFTPLFIFLERREGNGTRASF
jgi:hypothetical protein